jgi:LCP family protein required for cell wall assembly
MKSFTAKGLLLMVLLAVGGYASVFLAQSFIQQFKEFAPLNSAQLPSFGLFDLGNLSGDLRATEEGRTNALFLGISGKDYISGELTDTIIFASLGPSRTTVHLFSIPRDLWVAGDEGHFQKINELYRLEGGTDQPSLATAESIRAKVSAIVGQPIHYTAIVDLEAVRIIVDELGGVDINGEHLDGDAALFYIRDRSTPRGDFDRMLRQQELLRNIYRTLSSLESSEQQQKLFAIYNALAENAVSDAGIPQLLTLWGIGPAIAEDHIYSHTITPAEHNLLTVQYVDVAGKAIYTVRPSAGLEHYEDIASYVRDQLSAVE